MTSTSLGEPAKGDVVCTTSVEELTDEFISKTQEDSAAVETVVFSSMAKTCCGSGRCWLNHQTARFVVLCWPFCYSTFKILISKLSGVKRSHSFLLEAGCFLCFRKLEVKGIPHNTIKVVYW